MNAGRYFAQYVEVLDFAQVTIGWVEGCRGCWGARTFWFGPCHAMSQQESSREIDQEFVSEASGFLHPKQIPAFQ